MRKNGCAVDGNQFLSWPAVELVERLALAHRRGGARERGRPGRGTGRRCRCRRRHRTRRRTDAPTLPCRPASPPGGSRADCRSQRRSRRRPGVPPPVSCRRARRRRPRETRAPSGRSAAPVPLRDFSATSAAAGVSFTFSGSCAQRSDRASRRNSSAGLCSTFFLPLPRRIRPLPNQREV